MSATAPAVDAAAPAQEATSQAETFSRDYVESLRTEAAKYRTEKKEAVEAGKAEVIKEYESKAADLSSKLAELESSSSASLLELLKLKTVLGAEIPAADVLEVVALVQGTDEESVLESVNRVKSLLGKAPAKVLATSNALLVRKSLINYLGVLNHGSPN